MEMKKVYVLPAPIVDSKEETSLAELTEKYEKLIAPTKLSIAGEKIGGLVPVKIKEMGTSFKESISEAEIFAQAMKIAAEGFRIIEEQAAKFTISEKTILKKINKTVKDNDILAINEICLARGYDISKIVSSYKTQDILAALAEGGVTGFAGFAGIPFNLVLSTFLYYRAVQSVAMFYGYDVKNDSSELMIAGEVFMNALNPSNSEINEMSTMISKIMVFTESTVVKESAKKTWEEMASRGGVTLILTQLRALANKSAQKALDEAGKKGLEKTVFNELFEQIGKRLTKDAIKKGVPYVSAALGALIDVAQMKKVLEYADIFYHKRFIFEKEDRINLINNNIGADTYL